MMPCVLWRNLAIWLEQALFAHEAHGRGIELGFIDCVDDDLLPTAIGLQPLLILRQSLLKP
jgi:hypothetical protein